MLRLTCVSTRAAVPERVAVLPTTVSSRALSERRMGELSTYDLVHNVPLAAIL